MSRTEIAFKALTLVATVALAVGVFVLIPHIRAERWVPVVRETDTSDYDSLPVLLIAGATDSQSVHMLDTSTTLAEIVTLAGDNDHDTPITFTITLGEGDGTDGPQRVDLNNAEAWLLEALPGIGPEKAKTIVEYRENHGHFTCTEELALVPGIGPSTCEALSGLITVLP